MKVIYIAGPYRAGTEHGVVENIRKAEALAIKVWQAGYVALCPHLNTRLFGGLCPDEVWLEGDKELLRRCDAVMTIPGWSCSLGACDEIGLARVMNLPVYHSIEELRKEYDNE